jgi:hypothetical protein
LSKTLNCFFEILLDSVSTTVARDAQQTSHLTLVDRMGKCAPQASVRDEVPFLLRQNSCSGTPNPPPQMFSCLVPRSDASGRSARGQYLSTFEEWRR